MEEKIKMMRWGIDACEVAVLVLLVLTVMNPMCVIPMAFCIGMDRVLKKELHEEGGEGAE